MCKLSLIRLFQTDRMEGFLATLASALYIGIAAFVLRAIVRKHSIGSILFGVIGAAALLHAVDLYFAISSSDGNDMSLTNVLSLVALIMSVTMLFSIRIVPNILLMPGVCIFSGLSVLAAAFIPDHHIMKIALSAGMVTHITLSLLAYGFLSIAFLYALQMIIIQSRLKHKEISLIESPLPPLMVVESFLFQLTLAGTIILVIGLITGFLFLDTMLSSQYAHKTVLSITAFILYCLLLVGQKLWGWRNKQVVVLTSIGLICLTLAYFGSRFVREVIL